MKIYCFQLGQIGTNCFVVLPENSKGALVVDAPLEAASVVPEFLKKNSRTLDAILLTHPHWDHIWDAAPLAAATGAKVYAAASAKEFVEQPQMQQKKLFAPDVFDAAKLDVAVYDNEEFEIDGIKIKCLDVPGHCPGSIAYLLSDGSDSKVFVGDLLFNGSVGRTDFYGGNFAQLEKSIRNKIYTLPDDTEVLTGHGSATTVGAEKHSNPFVSE